jgi:hypothetical protein
MLLPPPLQGGRLVAVSPYCIRLHPRITCGAHFCLQCSVMTHVWYLYCVLTHCGLCCVVGPLGSQSEFACASCRSSFFPPGKETSGSWAKMEYASPRARVFSLQKWAEATRNERPWRPAALSAATNPAPLHGRATPSALWTTNGHVHRRCALQLMPPLLLRVRLPPPEHPLLRSSSAPPPPSPPSAVEW